ncbi:MAG: ATP phosphoribosyltransferase [Firmicutes bacterium]|jgi:ATP phosphoribosyltransferase|nr:ATP phosphoribosyltransferase [Bacillota bacterium]
MLKIALPKGSLEVPTLDLFAEADLAVIRSSDVDYRAHIDDPRVSEVRILRPQEIPRYVAEGIFDLGVTGRDWINETEADVESLAVLPYSKRTTNPIKVVLAVGGDSGMEKLSDIKDGTRIATEYPKLTERFFEKLGVKVSVQPSYGATEAKIPEIADAVVEITETGKALRAAGLKIIAVLQESYTELIANRSSFAEIAKAHAMSQLRTLLLGTLEARQQVLVKMNVAKENLQKVIDVLPSMKAPTVSELYRGEGFAVETVVPKSSINILIPELCENGATDILELKLSKIVH